MSTVTRSTGIPTGYMGLMAGAGYRGKTEELDALVQKAADELAAEYGCDVEIRFNTDRLSGGAWLKNNLTGWDANCQIGVGAGLRKRLPDGMKRIDALSDRNRKWWDSLPYDQLYFHAYVKESCLDDPRLANNPGRDGREGYAYIEQPTIEAALEWVFDHALLP